MQDEKSLSELSEKVIDPSADGAEEVEKVENTAADTSENSEIRAEGEGSSENTEGESIAEGESSSENTEGESAAEGEGEKYVWVKERYDGEKPKTLGGKISNFWFHHKGKVIASVIVVAIISLIVFQFIGKEKYDITVIYAGGYQISRLEVAGTKAPYVETFESFEKVASDFDGNGDVSVHLNDFYYLTDEEIATKEAEGKSINYNKLKEDRDNFHNTIKSSDACLLFLSAALYDELYYDSAFSGGKLFTDLSPILSASGAEGYEFYGGDTKAVLLKSLDFSTLPGISALPDDTVVCLRIESDGFAGIGSNSGAYNNSVEMIKNLFSYKAAEISAGD